jgi:predicted lipoprotein with Yx(FWY)xxD motif
MRRLLPIVLLVAVGSAAAASPAVTVKAGKLKSVGAIVVTGQGLTLYHMSSETKGSIKCLGVCTTIWQPLTVSGGGKPTAGPGINASKLGTRKRPDGKVQVTYFGLGLYRYVHDARPGQAGSQALGGNWYAVTTSGHVTSGASTGVECAPGETMQGVDDGNDSDDHGGPSDGDGCI